MMRGARPLHRMGEWQDVQKPPFSMEVCRLSRKRARRDGLTRARAGRGIGRAGACHNVINTGCAPLRLYTIYAPPEHRDGVVHKTKEMPSATMATTIGTARQPTTARRTRATLDRLWEGVKAIAMDVGLEAARLAERRRTYYERLAAHRNSPPAASDRQKRLKGCLQNEQDFFISVDRGVIAIAIVTAIILVVNQLARTRRASLLHRTIREAINSNSPLAPTLIEKLDEKPTYKGDARTGLVLLAVAVALILFGLIQESAHVRAFIAVAMFPAAVGAVLFGRACYAARKGLDS